MKINCPHCDYEMFVDDQINGSVIDFICPDCNQLFDIVYEEPKTDTNYPVVELMPEKSSLYYKPKRSYRSLLIIAAIIGCIIFVGIIFISFIGYFIYQSNRDPVLVAEEKRIDLAEKEKERLEKKFGKNFKFVANYKPVITGLKNCLELDHSMTNGISRVWYDAIFKSKGKDFTTEVFKLMATEEYKEAINNTDSSMKNIQAQLRKMKVHGADADKSYEFLIDAYTKIEELHGLLINPDGNYESYLKSTDQSYKEARALIKKAEIYAPDDVVEWDKLDDDLKQDVLNQIGKEF